MACLVEELHEDRVTVEVGRGVLPLCQGLWVQVLDCAIKERGDPDERGGGDFTVEDEADPVSTCGRKKEERTRRWKRGSIKEDGK